MNIRFVNCPGSRLDSLRARPPPAVEVVAVDSAAFAGRVVDAARIAAAVVAENNDDDCWRSCCRVTTSLSVDLIGGCLLLFNDNAVETIRWQYVTKAAKKEETKYTAIASS